MTASIPKDGLRDLRSMLAINVHRWKFKALDDSINKLRLHFPITDEMLEEMKALTRERYTTANRAFRMADLKHYENAHRWEPLLQKMSQEEALVHAIWDYVQDLANTRQHAAFRKCLMDICMEVGQKHFDRISETRATNRTPAQRKMIIQSLVIQKRFTRTEPLTAGISPAFTPKPSSRASTVADLLPPKAVSHASSQQAKYRGSVQGSKEGTLAKLQNEAENRQQNAARTEDLLIERHESNLSKDGEYELDEEVASLPDSSESNVTTDSGFKSGNRRAGSQHRHMEDDLDKEDGDVNWEKRYGVDSDHSSHEAVEKQRETCPLRPKSVRSLRRDGGLGLDPRPSNRCADCAEHLREIERQRSDLSCMAVTLESHERAFAAIQKSVHQLLHPRTDLGATDTTNPELLLRDIERTIRSIQSEIDGGPTSYAEAARSAMDERRRLQEMVDTLTADKQALERQQLVLEKAWKESQQAHQRDLERHRGDIEKMKREMTYLTETHREELKEIVEEHRRDMSDNRQQFSAMMATVMHRLNTPATGESSPFEPWANMNRGSRTQSRAVSRSQARPGAERVSFEDEQEPPTSTAANPVALSLTPRLLLQRPARSPDAMTSKYSVSGDSDWQHPADSLIMLHSRTRSRRRGRTPRGGVGGGGGQLPETMRVSPDTDPTTALSILPSLHPVPQLARLASPGPGGRLTAAPTRENSFTTISDLTRKAGRKSMQLHTPSMLT